MSKTWKIIILVAVAVFFISFCSGCAGLQTNQRESGILGGAATAVVANELADKVKEILRVKVRYPGPIPEICLPIIDTEPEQWQEIPEDEGVNFGSVMRAFGGRVHCILGRCDTDSGFCERIESWDSYAARNGGRFTSTEVNITNVENHAAACKVLPETCYDLMAEYEEQSILFTIEDGVGVVP